MRVRATDKGWDGIGLKLREKGEEFDLPAPHKLAPEWMERVDGETSEPSEISETVSPEVQPTKKPGRPRKDVI